VTPKSLFPALICLALTGCVSTAREEVPSEFRMSSPSRTIAYLRWAFENRYASHVYNTLSDDLIGREQISLDDLATFWPRVEEWVHENIGDPGTIEIVRQKRLDARTREVELASGDRRAVLRFVLQVTWLIRPMSSREDDVTGRMRDLAGAVTYEGDDALIRIPGVEKQIDPEKIHVIRIENAWKIDAVLDTNLPEWKRPATADP